MEKNHKHLILNAKVTNPINCDKECEGWLTNLVKLIDMEILVPPMVKYCDIEGNEGVTGVVVITTSHISIHIWPQQPQPYIRMDVYSCKDFDPKSVINYVHETMEIVEEEHMVIDRNAKMQLIA
jgi:S-adenosylmethionine decarboxylase